MEIDFFEFLWAVKESNKAHNMALHCAELILKRAEEIHPVMRGHMIDLVAELIRGERIKEKKVKSPEGKKKGMKSAFCNF